VMMSGVCSVNILELEILFFLVVVKSDDEIQSRKNFYKIKK
jgi:hypothetical protein